MKLTANEDYGVRCLVRLAYAGFEEQSLTIPEISLAEGVSPAYAAMIRYLGQHAAALCVTEPTGEAMNAALASLKDAGKRQVFVENARALATRKLSTAAMREVWSQGLAQLSKQKVESRNLES